VMAAAKAALQLRIGNCEAQAALGYFYIVEHWIPRPGAMRSFAIPGLTRSIRPPS
jgi:hypothetical protein